MRRSCRGSARSAAVSATRSIDAGDRVGRRPVVLLERLDPHRDRGIGGHARGTRGAAVAQVAPDLAGDRRHGIGLEGAARGVVAVDRMDQADGAGLDRSSSGSPRQAKRSASARTSGRCVSIRRRPRAGVVVHGPTLSL